jgi:hypothetical protein
MVYRRKITIPDSGVRAQYQAGIAPQINIQGDDEFHEDEKAAPSTAEV